MYIYFLAPLFDSILSYLIEQPIQQYFYINYIQYYPIYIKSFLIFIITTIINILLITIIYSNLFNANILSDERMRYQIIFTFLGLVLSYILIYYLLIKLKKYNATKQINLLLIISYIVSYICKVIATYLIWK